MTLLPFQAGDAVQWRGEPAVVVEVRRETIAVETGDTILHITTDAILRSMQPVRAA